MPRHWFGAHAGHPDGGLGEVAEDPGDVYAAV
jgi:hypothetical protein